MRCVRLLEEADLVVGELEIELGDRFGEVMLLGGPRRSEPSPRGSSAPTPPSAIRLTYKPESPSLAYFIVPIPSVQPVFRHRRPLGQP